MRSAAAAAPLLSLLTMSVARSLTRSGVAAFAPLAGHIENKHVASTVGLPVSFGSHRHGRHPPSSNMYYYFYSYSTTSTSSLAASIVDEVTAEMKAAMKSKDTATLSTIRLIRSAFANAAIEQKTKALTDEQARQTLRKMAKMRQESIAMFEEGGATDRADAERAELAVIERWLPSLADEQTTREWVLEAIESTGVRDVSKMGLVMGALMKEHKAELDGKMAQKIVREELGK